jgi:hypothetical protein
VAEGDGARGASRTANRLVLAGEDEELHWFVEALCRALLKVATVGILRME